MTRFLVVYFLCVSINICFTLTVLWLIAMLGIDVKKNVIVTISSDKGLCGGINSTSVKTSKGFYKINSGTRKN